MIDALSCMAVVAAAITMADTFEPDADSRLGLLLILTVLLASPVFFLIKDGFRGFSLGKRLMGVRVVDSKTLKPIGFFASAARNATPVFLQLAVPVIAIQLEEGYRLGDGLGRSKVIWLRYAEHPVFTGLPLGDGARVEQGGFAPWRVGLPRAQESTYPFRPPQQ